LEPSGGSTHFFVSRVHVSLSGPPSRRFLAGLFLGRKVDLPPFLARPKGGFVSKLSSLIVVIPVLEEDLPPVREQMCSSENGGNCFSRRLSFHDFFLFFFLNCLFMCWRVFLGAGFARRFRRRGRIFSDFSLFPSSSPFYPPARGSSALPFRSGSSPRIPQTIAVGTGCFG